MVSLPIALLLAGGVVITLIIAFVIWRMRRRDHDVGDIYPLF